MSPSPCKARTSCAKTLSQDEIDPLDKAWRAEHNAKAKPLITGVLANPLSTYLTRIQARSDGLFTEIIVVASKGLNIGQSAVTNDMWQGDEDKFQKTHGVGPGAVFGHVVEWHEQSRTWRAQMDLMMTLAVAVGAILSALAIGAMVFSRMVAVRPLRLLTAATAKLRARDWSVVIPDAGKSDEIGQLAKALEVMRA